MLSIVEQMKRFKTVMELSTCQIKTSLAVYHQHTENLTDGLFLTPKSTRLRDMEWKSNSVTRCPLTPERMASLVLS